MALKTLTTAEMITLSARWTDPRSDAFQAITGIPTAAPVLTHLSAAHAGLLATQPKAPDSARLAALSEEAGAIDVRHDTVKRAVEGILAGFAEAAPDAAGAEPLLRLRQIVLPDGLAATQRSYRDEAGEGALLAERLTPGVKDALGKLQTPFGTVLDLVTEGISLAARLGALEDERAKLSQAKPQPPTAADVVTARNKWIRATSALVSMLELHEPEPAMLDKLLGPLRQAEAVADRRGHRKGEGQ